MVLELELVLVLVLVLILLELELVLVLVLAVLVLRVLVLVLLLMVQVLVLILVLMVLVPAVMVLVLVYRCCLDSACVHAWGCSTSAALISCWQAEERAHPHPLLPLPPPTAAARVRAGLKSNDASCRLRQAVRVNELAPAPDRGCSAGTWKCSPLPEGWGPRRGLGRGPAGDPRRHRQARGSLKNAPISIFHPAPLTDKRPSQMFYFQLFKF